MKHYFSIYPPEAPPTKLLYENRIKYAVSGGTNYFFNEEDGAILGGAELQGKRPTQEDRMIAETLPPELGAFQTLSSEEQKKVIGNTFKALNTECYALHQAKASRNLYGDVDVHWEGPGSTALVAFIDPRQRKVLVANIGDSEAYLVHFKPHLRFPNDNNKTRRETTERLNKIHQPNEEGERKRLQKAKVRTPFNKLYSHNGGFLAVSRAVGDFAYKKSGLIATPEFTEIRYTCEVNETSYLVMACDGLTENNCLHLRDFSFRLNDTTPKPLGQMAWDLASLALERGSKDNISVQICNLSALSAQNHALLVLGIFDGHNGAEFSAHLQMNFMRVFKQELERLTHSADDVLDALFETNALTHMFETQLTLGDESINNSNDTDFPPPENKKRRLC